MDNAIRFGSLLCQRDSYQTQVNADVVECKQVAPDDFQVMLSDSVIFPEGGGQPDDVGRINGIPVKSMSRSQGTVYYHLAEPVEPSNVTVEVDWDRRFDHMQQHSGQHLFSAVALRDYGSVTESWSMGDFVQDGEVNINYVMVSPPSAPSLSLDQFKREIDRKCNELIREDCEMAPRWIEQGSTELEELNITKLPEGTVGPIRVVSIQGLDNNVCCGTHVKSLRDLQALKVLQVEVVKKSWKVTFVVGQRLLAFLDQSFLREKQLTKELSCPPTDFVQRVQGLTKTQKQSAKTKKTLTAELAKLVVEQLAAKVDQGETLHCLHYPELDGSFTQSITKALSKRNVLLFVVTGNGADNGAFCLFGPPFADFVSSFGPKVVEILEGKGGGGKGKFQGKCSKPSKFDQVAPLVVAAFEEFAVGS